MTLKEFLLRYLPAESGFFDKKFEYPPSFIQHKRISRPIEESTVSYVKTVSSRTVLIN